MPSAASSSVGSTLDSASSTLSVIIGNRCTVSTSSTPCMPYMKLIGCLHAEPVHQQDVDGAGAPENEDEPQHADQRRQDQRQHRQVGEEIAAREIVADEEKGDRDADHRGREHRGDAEHHRFPERAQIEGVGEELLEVGERQLPRLVGEGIVEDADQRKDDEHDQERPDQAEPERGRRCAGQRHLSSRIAMVLLAGNVTATVLPIGSTSWCQGSRTSALKMTPGPSSTS